MIHLSAMEGTSNTTITSKASYTAETNASSTARRKELARVDAGMAK
jgi:hypothetical protein